MESVDVDGELVLWDPVTQRVHRLDRVGSLLWPFFDGEATIAEIAADAADAWNQPSARVESDLVGLAMELARFGLVTDGPAADAQPAPGPPDPAYLTDPPAP